MKVNGDAGGDEPEQEYIAIRRQVITYLIHNRLLFIKYKTVR